MKNRARVGALVACTSLLVTGGVAFLQGCGGDDTVVDAGNRDAEAGLDTNVLDGTTAVDAADAADAADVGFVTEASCDAAPIQQFADEMVKSMCGRYSTCCFPDAATFDQPKCEAVLKGAGGWNEANSELVPTALNSCSLVLDQNAATACLAGLQTFSCPSLSATEQTTTTNNCYGAVYGTIPIGQPGCTYSVQCAPGAFCAQNPDGGKGSCQALAQNGADCVQANGITVNANFMCAYRGHVNEQRYCDRSRVSDAGVATGKCQPLLPDGVPCINAWDCKSGACGDNSLCGSVTTTTDPQFICPFFKKDGG